MPPRPTSRRPTHSTSNTHNATPGGRTLALLSPLTGSSHRNNLPDQCDLQPTIEVTQHCNDSALWSRHVPDATGNLHDGCVEPSTHKCSTVPLAKTHVLLDHVRASSPWPLASGLWPLASGLWPNYVLVHPDKLKICTGTRVLATSAARPRAGFWPLASGPTQCVSASRATQHMN